MPGKQVLVDLHNKESLISNVDRMQKEGYRLGQACATRKGDLYEVVYSFVKNDELVNIRIKVKEGEEIESVSGMYPYAFLYENEMQDLFGLTIKHINIDFKGSLYQLKTKAPFAGEKKPSSTTGRL